MRELSWEEVKKIIRRIGEWGILGLMYCLGQQIDQRFIPHKWHSSHEGHEQSSKKAPTLLRGSSSGRVGEWSPVVRNSCPVEVTQRLEKAHLGLSSGRTTHHV